MVNVIALGFLPQAAEDARHPQTYRVAGCALVTDVPLPVLAPFEWGRKAPEFQGVLPRSPVKRSGAKLVYRGPGWIGNQWREVECWSDSAGHWFELEGVGRFTITPEGRTITVDRAERAAEWPVIVEAALGPAFILALALQGTWCLHASAAVGHDHAVAFLGESGNGKSTLAAHLGTGRDAVWRRIADDVLPITSGPDGPEALPYFPQLKLPPEMQPSLGMPQRLPLDAVYLLGKPAADHGEIEVQPLGKREAMLALVRHTIAARLFDKDLLLCHMRFCAQTAARIPVRRVTYPRQAAALPRVRDAIEADLQTL